MELAEGLPPYQEKSPEEALELIKRHGAPPLKQPEKWSTEFREFINICLQKDPERRINSSELRKHPFLQKACSKEDFVITVVPLAGKVHNQPKVSVEYLNSMKETKSEPTSPKTVLMATTIQKKEPIYNISARKRYLKKKEKEHTKQQQKARSKPAIRPESSVKIPGTEVKNKTGHADSTRRKPGGDRHLSNRTKSHSVSKVSTRVQSNHHGNLSRRHKPHKKPKAHSPLAAKIPSGVNSPRTNVDSTPPNGQTVKTNAGRTLRSYSTGRHIEGSDPLNANTSKT